MHVKICGITNDEDLKTCENHGIAFIGFINVERSKRFLDIDEINELKNKMKNPEKAVLVLEPLNTDEFMNKSQKSGIKNVQLHSLRDDEISKINDINVIRAIGIPEKMDEEKIREIENFARVCDYLLLIQWFLGKVEELEYKYLLKMQKNQPKLQEQLIQTLNFSLQVE